LFFGNIFISVCAFCQFWTTCLLWQLPLPRALGLLVFLATFVLYNFDGLLPYKLQQQVSFSRRRAWAQQHKKILIFLMILAGIGALCLVSRTIFYQQHLLLLGHLGVLAVLYSLPVLPRRGQLWPLRHIPLLKIFLIAYVWTCVTVWLPLLAYNQPIFSETAWLFFLRRFLFVLAITIIFDIRDVERDRVTGTITLPGTIGVKNAKYIAGVSLVLFSLLVGLAPPETHRAALWLSGVVTGYVVWQTEATRSEYFFSVVADGMMVLQFLLVWLW
jgi:4-hydroxybenzoate polyprenyltransferase